MLKEAIEKIASLVPPTVIDGAPGFKHSDRALSQVDVRPAVDDIFHVETLGGLVDSLTAIGWDQNEVLAYVVNPTCVQIRERECDQYGRRAVLAQAKLPDFRAFPFDNFMVHEQFVISVMTLMAGSPDREYVLQMAQKVTSGQTVTTEDDGITQSAVIQTGAALKGQVTLKARVLLAPYRTFREVAQPLSEFVFRLTQGGDGKPQLMLKESDGGAWRIDAIANIKVWLAGKLPSGIPIIA
jgi:hypothetical protein